MSAKVRPARHILVCCDGTNLTLGPAPSNVLQFYDAFDQGRPADAAAVYLPGVGAAPAPDAATSLSQAFARVAGIAAGAGLLDLVRRGYEFISAHYGPGSQIYLVGFSRGALEARLIAGLITRVGLLRPDRHDEWPAALALYEPHDTLTPDAAARVAARDARARFRDAHCVPGDVRIGFLGLWDTVKAFGIFNPRSFPHLRHNDAVEHVRHALALDECRRSYVHTTWGGLDEFDEAGPRPGQIVKEVWFAGVHSDVGGGIVKPCERGRAHHALRWMLGEAYAAGLPFDAAALRDAVAAPWSSADGWLKIHDPSVLERWGWQLVDLIPRRELFNAPPLVRAAATPMRRVSTRDADHLPVPFGWPRRPWTWRPVRGVRDVEASRRHGVVSVHRSVEPLMRDGRYRLESVAFVDDEPLPPAPRSSPPDPAASGSCEPNPLG